MANNAKCKGWFPFSPTKILKPIPRLYIFLNLLNWYLVFGAFKRVVPQYKIYSQKWKKWKHMTEETIFSKVQSNAEKTDEYSRKNTGGKIFYFFRLAGHRLHSTQLFRTLSFSSSSTLSMVFTITFWVCTWFFFFTASKNHPMKWKDITQDQ